MMDIDLQVRLAAFNWLTERVNSYGDVLPMKLLEQGFEFQGQRIPLVAPQGIFKPQILDLPLSITTAPKGPTMITSARIISCFIATAALTQTIAIM